MGPIGASGDHVLAPLARQRSEQYFTWSQSRAHFFRQVKGRWQAVQVLEGSADLLRFIPFAFWRTPFANGLVRVRAYFPPPAFFM
jgi:hypothetical protein